MKKLNKYLLIIALIVLSLKVSYATNPPYSLKVKNNIQIDSNTMQFEIFLKNTNPGANVLNYLIAQYILKVNPSYANGGTMTLSIAPGIATDVSDLPPVYFPQKFQVSGNQIMISGNLIPDDPNRPVISSTVDGTRIIRVRLHTTANSFSGQPNLKWKNVGSGGFATKLGLLVNGTPQKVTDSTAHSVETGLKNLTLTFNFQACPNAKPITVELRSSISPYALVESANGTGGGNTASVISFGNAVNGTPYYVVVKSENSLETWSAAPVSFTSQSASYDFSTAINKAYGNNQILNESSIPSIYQGDVNQDGLIDLTDLSLTYNVVSSFSTTPETDLNCDGTTDLTDLSQVYNNANSFIQLQRPPY